MSEPEEWANEVVPVVDGIYRWAVHDDRIANHESDSYAVVVDGRVTLIDPLPIHTAAIQNLGDVEAIILTAGNHQRATWRLRREFGVPVFAPQNASGLEHRANGYYMAGEALPGGLIAFHTPGPIESMHVLWRPTPTSVVFLSDLVTHDGSGALSFVPGKYQDEPLRTRESVRRVLEKLQPEVLCFNHGPPLVRGAREALERALREDTELGAVHGP